MLQRLQARRPHVAMELRLHAVLAKRDLAASRGVTEKGAKLPEAGAPRTPDRSGAILRADIVRALEA
jgi:hypothetical protein